MTMIDVSDKPEVYREAAATGTIRLKPQTIRLMKEGKVRKGDPFHAAKIAGVLAAKKTSMLIPFCHPLPLTSVEVKLSFLGDSAVKVACTVRTKARTGVEMEALVATSLSLLTIWDMVKQYEKNAEGQYPFTLVKNVKIEKKIKQEI